MLTAGVTLAASVDAPSPVQPYEQTLAFKCGKVDYRFSVMVNAEQAKLSFATPVVGRGVLNTQAAEMAEGWRDLAALAQRSRELNGLSPFCPETGGVVRLDLTGTDGRRTLTDVFMSDRQLRVGPSR